MYPMFRASTTFVSTTHTSLTMAKIILTGLKFLESLARQGMLAECQAPYASIQRCPEVEIRAIFKGM